MNWLLDRLGDEATRSALAWLGGGIAALAAGMWTVIKFWLERRVQKPRGRADGDAKPSSSSSNVRVSASGGSVAGGRDVNIGMKSLHVVVGGLLLVGLLLFGASFIGDRVVREAVDPLPPIPAFSLSLTCGDDTKGSPFTLSDDERKSLVDFAEFFDQHRDQPVYVSMAIEKACGGCGCPREVPLEKYFNDEIVDDQTDEEIQKGSLLIDSAPPQSAGDQVSDHGARINHEGIAMVAFAPQDWAYGITFHMPRASQLSDPQYRSGEYGFFMKFDGLFNARNLDRTGGANLSLDPIQPSETQLQQLRCIRDAGTLSKSQRLYLGCSDRF
ncbi:hypothetical protein [Pseudoxanthomonas sp. CF125]|uniref:hypothetical protein n=1 Tax=Pseudoxanthomonas sp. CF125 TaxID=1855303 RepID=UPI0008873A79|nr:hypothetical protein [Pseudoxanthomonas sp. CF125]SDR10612.1 hypothetical protein SAMN05216569_3121 [Pseudoxanthomonas sp. CF125]